MNKENEVRNLFLRWSRRECPSCGREGVKTPSPMEGSVMVCPEHGAYWDYDYLLSLAKIMEEKGIFPLSDQELSAFVLALRLYLDVRGR